MGRARSLILIHTMTKLHNPVLGPELYRELRLEVDKRQKVVENSIRVRQAVEGDIPWILEELQEFDALQGTTRISLLPRDEPMQVQRLHAILYGCCQSDSKGLISNPFFVATRGQRRLGFICGVVTPHFMNPEIVVAYELLFWVPPRNRKTSAGIRLLNHYTDWCRANVDWAFFSIHHDTPMAARHLEKRGYKFVENTFRLEV